MIESRPHIAPRVDTHDASSGYPLGYTFLSSQELSLFRLLIEDRRPLPVCRAGGWVCYECLFEAPDLAAVVEHILRAHQATPRRQGGLGHR
jgi:hypothetical protein